LDPSPRTLGPRNHALGRKKDSEGISNKGGQRKKGTLTTLEGSKMHLRDLKDKSISQLDGLSTYTQVITPKNGGGLQVGYPQ